MIKRRYLVRHCESTGQDSDAPLTPKGFAQANALASHLAGIGAEFVPSGPCRTEVTHSVRVLIILISSGPAASPVVPP